MVIKDILKGVFRFIHLTSGCYIIGNAISDVIWSERSFYITLETYLAFGLALLVSGVINIILIKPSEELSVPDKKVWNYLIYAKAFVWILFIPIPDLIAEASGHHFPRTQFNAALVIVMLLLSVSAKTIRDVKRIKDSQ